MLKRSTVVGCLTLALLFITAVFSHDAPNGGATRRLLWRRPLARRNLLDGGGTILRGTADAILQAAKSLVSQGASAAAAFVSTPSGEPEGDPNAPPPCALTNAACAPSPRNRSSGFDAMWLAYHGDFVDEGARRGE